MTDTEFKRIKRRVRYERSIDKNKERQRHYHRVIYNSILSYRHCEVCDKYFETYYQRKVTCSKECSHKRIILRRTK